MSQIVEVTNTSAVTLTITDPAILAYSIDNSFRPAEVLNLPVEYRYNDEIVGWKNDGFVEVRIIEGDSSSLGIPRASEIMASNVVVLPNDNPLIQESNVQDFLDDVEDILAQGGGGGGSRFKVEEITLTVTDISNKYIILQHLPCNTNISLSVANGPQQSHNQDYILTGQTVNWAGRGLDGLVSIGDELVIEYEHQCTP